MATPADEIQRQHAEAANLVEQGLSFAEPKSTQEISLSNKAHSIAQLDKNEQDRLRPFWSSRGHADVRLLQDLVREGYNLKYDLSLASSSAKKSGAASKPKGSNKKQPTTNNNAAKAKAPPTPRYSQTDVQSKTNLWDPINASVNNVAICRPSHDAWGIHKIVLLFCDDFCQCQYALPWWHQRADMRHAVQPILDVLDIAPEQVVRLLLASLPPDVTIPVHEDSGAWVAKTHRVHVPVLVEGVDQILFRCGPAVDRMDRIQTEPGHVFEINNQAKHTVSNCSDDYRVHLILDYVDNDHYRQNSLPPPINLEPGEILLQTRRSIDRWKDRGSRKTPSFLILGAQKAGTTSLYDYMTQHPLIVGAKRRETHCLDWRWNTSLNTVEEQRRWCHQFYHSEELFRHPSCLTGDSTPSYLLDSRRVIPRLKQVFDWPLRFLVMLRNPIQRAESHFAMVTSTEGTPAQIKTRGTEWREKSFRQVVMEDLEHMQRCGLIPYWDIEEGTLDRKLFDSFSGSEKEDQAWDLYMKDIPLNTGSHCLLGRGLYELNLRPWFQAFDKSDVLVLRLESFKTEGVSTAMDKVWKHLGVPHHVMEDESPKNTRDYEPLMDLQLRRYLERFFDPHNQRLSTLLGKNWEGVWPAQEELENKSPQQP